MKENYEICHCRKVTYGDIEDALHDHKTFGDVLESFKHVQAVTHCSTGCGGCYQEVLDVISELMMGASKA